MLRHGRVITEGWWAPYAPDLVHVMHSASKTVTATALGFAVAEGLLRLDDPVVRHFGSYPAATQHPWTREMTVRHLAAMATGHQEDTLERAVALDPGDLVGAFLQIPPDQAPGGVFAYNNAATYVLAAIVQDRAGQSLTDYLRPRLFDPLGIERVYWNSSYGDRELGFTGLHLTTESLAKLAQLHLADGVWQGRRVLPAGWVAEATSVHTPTPAEPNPDWRLGYGYQMWRSRHGYRLDGAYGQFGLVLPELDAVIATTAATEQMQVLLDLVWDHLVPAFDAETSPADDAELGRRLESLQLALPTEHPYDADAWLSAVGLTETGGGRVELTVVDQDHRLQIACTPDGWTRSSPEISPGHRLQLAARGAGGSRDCSPPNSFSCRARTTWKSPTSPPPAGPPPAGTPCPCARRRW